MEEREERKVKEIMTVKEFAVNSGLTESSVRKLIQVERLYYMKIGSRYYINYPKSMDFLMSNPIADIIWHEPKR